MARPKVYNEKRITTAVRLPATAHKKLADAARERDVSVNYLINRAVDQYLAALREPA
jgi:predicted HicB family RNase H-like nuclease